jgi:hypothetical protein
MTYLTKTYTTKPNRDTPDPSLPNLTGPNRTGPSLTAPFHALLDITLVLYSLILGTVNGPGVLGFVCKVRSVGGGGGFRNNQPGGELATIGTVGHFRPETKEIVLVDAFLLQSFHYRWIYSTLPKFTKVRVL